MNQSYLLVPVAGLSAMLAILVYAARRRARAVQEVRDPLTGLLAADAFRMQFDRALERSRRKATPLAVLFADIDRLAAINGFYGNESGDSVLRHFGGQLRKLSGDGTAAARLGDDQFALLLPGIDHAAARGIAQRLAASVRGAPCPLQPDPIAYTVSVGAIAVQPGDDAEALMRRADAALKTAKLAGRDTVGASSPREGAPAWATLRRRPHAISATVSH